MKPFVSSLVILSIWISIFTPFIPAQNQSVAATAIQTKAEGKGLTFRVRETKPEAAKPTPTPVNTVKLGAAETDSILAKLSPLPATGETADFKLPTNYLPPSKGGNVVTGVFPSADNTRPPRIGENGPLSVVRYSPSGTVGITPEISVTFSHAMVAVTSQEAVAENVPVKISPAVNGAWRWVGTKTLIFKADGKLPMATKFAVAIPAGTKSVNGGVLANYVTWEFSTNPPTVVAFSADNATVKRDERFFASFDQDINPQEVLIKTTATVNGQGIPLRLLTDAEMVNEISEIKEKKPELLKRVVGFRAVDLLPSGSKIDLVFQKNTPSAEGPLTSRTERKFSFNTFDGLKMTGFRCFEVSGTKLCDRRYPIMLILNNKLDPSSFNKSMVNVEPMTEGLSILGGGNVLRIHNPKPRTTYRVTVSTELKDIYGQNLARPITQTFTTDAVEAGIDDGREYEHFVSLAPSDRPTYVVRSTNLAALRVKIYSVKPENYQAFSNFLSNKQRVAPAFGKLVFKGSVKVEKKPDEEVVTAINLSSAIPNGIGHAVLIVDRPVGASRGEDRIVKWIQSSNIGLDALADDQRLSVFASDLKDGSPLPNIQISLTNGVSGTTSVDGLVDLKMLPPKKKKNENILLFASSSGDSAILEREETARDASLKASGWYASPRNDSLRWFVFDDRRMYRLGETVSVKGYLRKRTGGRNSDISELGGIVSNVSYVLKDRKEIPIAKGTSKLNAFGAFDFQIKLPEKGDLGEHTLELKAPSLLDSASHDHPFFVSEFRRPEFEVTAKVQSAGPYYVGTSATIVAEAKYYSGGGLASAETTWDVSAMPTNYSPPNHDDFSFGKFRPWWTYAAENTWELRTEETIKGRTDVEGKHHISLDFIKANPSRPYIITAESDVQDVNRQSISGETTMLVHPSKLYVGLRTPKAFVEKDENFTVEAITTDVDGKVVGGAPVTLVAELKELQQVKDKWESVVVDSQKCEIRSTEKSESCKFTAKKGGSYTVTATVLDENERRNESNLRISVAGGKPKPMRRIEEQQAEIIPTKKEYAPGETAEILINSPFYPAEGVMSLSRNGILKTERFSLSGPSAILKIPIEEAHLPNVHVGVTIVGNSKLSFFGDERDAKLPNTPAFATGAVNLSVSKITRKLTVTVEPEDKNLRPGGQTKVNLSVRDNSGNAVPATEIALVAVDESVLALSGYQIEDPVDVFYEPLPNGTFVGHSRENITVSDFSISVPFHDYNNYVSPVYEAANASTAANASATPGSARQGGIDFSLYSNLAKPAGRSIPIPQLVSGVSGYFDLGIPDSESLPLKSEDLKNSPQMMTLRRNFAALAIFAPSVRTDANGKASVELKLPDNLTRYRITAVAVTKSKQFGIGESNVTAKQSLMIRPSAPRFMNFGDTAEIPVVVQNQTDSPMTVDVVIRSDNAILTDGNGNKVTVPANDRTEIRFPVTTPKAGTARFQIGGTSGKFADAAEVEFPVYSPATSESFATYGTTDQNGAITQIVEAPKDIFPQFGGLEITTSSTQLQELTDAFIYLQNYPFECSEQIASRMLSTAALRDVLTAFNAKEMPSKAKIESKMNSDLERLAKLQNADGGFSFWRADERSIPFVTIHVAHALVLTKAKGYKVPTTVLTKALNYLNSVEASAAKLKYSKESVWAISAYSLYVRDLAGDSNLVKAKKLLTDAGLEKLSPESLGWILSVLAKEKKSTQIDAIKRHLLNRVTETADKAHFATKYTDGAYVLLSSDKRSDSVILEALLRLSVDDDLIPKLVRGLLADRNKGRWMSTQENSFVLLALDKYFRSYEKIAPNFVSNVWLNSGFAGEQKFSGRSTTANLINIPMSYLAQQKGAQNLTIEKQGDGRLYYRIGIRYAPKDLKLAASDSGFEVTRRYEALDNPADVKQNPDGTWTIKSGARIRVVVEMVNPSVRYHVALVDNLPAGFEIINPELAVSRSTENETTERFAQEFTWFEHQNLRDERAEAFRSYLNPGIWKYTYIARATTPGSFTAPPAKAEEMYSPETFGRSGTDLVRIE